MVHYIIYCMEIFFIVLECLVVLFLVQSFFPLSQKVRLFFLMMVSPILFPMQKIMKHSMMNTFSIDLSPYVILIILSYLERVCSYFLSKGGIL
ncbi:unknown [Clostridium sp. CAG:230]|nr:unknown [Clostridium sp. CAG:230]